MPASRGQGHDLGGLGGRGRSGRVVVVVGSRRAPIVVPVDGRVRGRRSGRRVAAVRRVADVERWLPTKASTPNSDQRRHHDHAGDRPPRPVVHRVEGEPLGPVEPGHRRPARPEASLVAVLRDGRRRRSGGSRGRGIRRCPAPGPAAPTGAARTRAPSSGHRSPASGSCGVPPARRWRGRPIRRRHRRAGGALRQVLERPEGAVVAPHRVDVVACRPAEDERRSTRPPRRRPRPPGRSTSRLFNPNRRGCGSEADLPVERSPGRPERLVPLRELKSLERYSQVRWR